MNGKLSVAQHHAHHRNLPQNAAKKAYQWVEPIIHVFQHLGADVGS
jgi:hypothetical protein